MSHTRIHLAHRGVDVHPSCHQESFDAFLSRQRSRIHDQTNRVLTRFQRRLREARKLDNGSNVLETRGLPQPCILCHDMRRARFGGMDS